MDIDILGKVHNTSLAASKPLLPLFEAIVNSIQSIEEAEIDNGTVCISILRDNSTLLKDDDNYNKEIIGFTVDDNGIGFTDDNFKAFSTSDTTSKASRGGKGVGRFLWLVAYEKVEIDSIYQKEERFYNRIFDFTTKESGIYNHKNRISSNISHNTKISLLNYKEKYRKQCPKRIDTIGTKIVEHCLEYFFQENCPLISIKEDSIKEEILLNDIFSQMVFRNKSDEIIINENIFHVQHLHLFQTHDKEHSISYCAHDRVVKNEHISSQIPNLSKRLKGEDGKEFVYNVYVESEVLDKSVNSERTTFAIPEDDLELQFKDFNWSDIRKEILACCKKYLVPYTLPVLEKKVKRIEAYVQTEAPQYRPILKHIEKRLELIKPDVTDNELEIELHHVYRDLEIDIKKEGNALKISSKDIKDFDKYKLIMEKYFEKVTDIGAADLAKYVCHRKTVIDFLEMLMGLNDQGKYHLEDQIHNTIFPMGKTSDEVLFKDHNLWLIDEKLVYHSFLASDIKFKSMKKLSSKSNKEPDIIVFDKACAFSSTESDAIQSIDIIEFKRPMRNDYTNASNPITQVLTYIDDINSGKAKRKDGRNFSIHKNTPFYCYIICDKSEKLTKIAEQHSLEPMPNELGCFGYIKAYKAFFEIIYYDKIISDAKKRNQAFFNKLKL